jgi:ABC-type glycerol-3-phosphate transport system substrate-binding protein
MMSNVQWIRLPLLMTMVLSMLLLTACGGSSTRSQNTQDSNGSASDAKPANTAVNKEVPAKPWGNGPIEIDFWHIQATIYGEAIKEIVAEFNKEYEGKVVVTEVFQGSYDDLNKKIRAALQGGGLPAVAMAYESDTLEYMRANVIVPLDSFIADANYGLTQAELDDIMPGVLARQRIPEYEGKTMSWPHGNSSMGVYYNMDLLKQAGFDKPAATWKEFEAQALAITEKTGVPALTMGTGKKGGTFRSWLRTYGIQPIADGAMAVNYANPEAVELVTVMKNLLDKGVIVLSENTEQEFTNGRAALEIATTARTSSKIDLIQGKFNWGMALIPQGGRPEPITELYGGNQVLFKKDANQELAGWLFLKYFASPKAQSIYAAKTGYFPATLSSQDTELLEQNYTQYPQKQQAFELVFPHAQIDVSTAARRPIDDAVSEAVELVLTGKLSPDDAMKKAQADATKALEQFK